MRQGRHMNDCYLFCACVVKDGLLAFGGTTGFVGSVITWLRSCILVWAEDDGDLCVRAAWSVPCFLTGVEMLRSVRRDVVDHLQKTHQSCPAHWYCVSGCRKEAFVIIPG